MRKTLIAAAVAAAISCPSQADEWKHFKCTGYEEGTTENLISFEVAIDIDNEKVEYDRSIYRFPEAEVWSAKVIWGGVTATYIIDRTDYPWAQYHRGSDTPSKGKCIGNDQKGQRNKF